MERHNQEYIEILQEIQVYEKSKKKIEDHLTYLKASKEEKEKIFRENNYIPKLGMLKIKSAKFGKTKPDGTEEIIHAII